MCVSNEKTTTPGEHPMSQSSGKSSIKEQAGSRASVWFLFGRHQHQLLQNCVGKTEKTQSMQDT